MPKKVRIVKDHAEAERQMLERSLQRTPEERILWLINQNKLMSEMNPNNKSLGYELSRKKR